MRYHKAAEISPLEARFIIDHNTTSRSACVVIEHYDQWFDVRCMTEQELASFLDDLRRTRLVEETSGILTPH